MAILIKGEYRTYLIIYQEEGITLVHRSFIKVYTLIKIKSVARLMGICNGTRKEV
jgi:hypothetical protein